MLAVSAVIPAGAASDSIEIICHEQRGNEYNSMVYETWNAGTGDNVKNACGRFINAAAAAEAGPSVKAGFTFTVPENGWYDANFILASGTTNEKICYAAENHSRVSYWLDDSASKTLLADSEVAGSGATVRTVSIQPFGNQDFNETQLLEPIYIEAGEHVIHFESTALSNRFSEDKVGYYSIKFTPTNVENITIKCADQRNNGLNSTLTETWTDGAIGRFIGKAAAAESGPIVKAGFTFTIREPGWYNMTTIIASCSTETYAAGNHSKLNYWFDNNDKKYFADSTMSGDPVLTTLDTDPLNNQGNFVKSSLLKPVYFAAGVHTVNFESFELSPNFSEDKVGFHSIAINKIDTSAMNDIIIHGGDYPTFTYKDIETGAASTLKGETNRNNLLDGGKLLVLYQNSPKADDNGYTFSAPFKIYDDGEFDINIKMWADGYLPLSLSGWGSKVKVSVDGGSEFYVKNYATTSDSEISAITVKEKLSSEYNLEPGLWKEYKLTRPIELSAGEHVINIRVSDTLHNVDSRSFKFGLDTIHIRPVSETSKALIEGEYMQKKDLDDADNVIENALFSNGKAGAIKDAGTVRMPFYISEAGNYNLGITANTTSGATWSIDGTAMSGFTSIRDLTTLGSGWADYKSANSVMLSAGVHVLDMTADTGAVFNVDKVEIFKPAAVSAISVEAPEVMQLGESGSLTVKNEKGETISFFDVDTMAFESGNEDIVAVDAYGNLTPVSCGETTVSACVYSGGKSVNAECIVKVVGESGLYVKAAAVDGNNVNVTLAACKEAAASKAVAAVYNVEDGKVTSFRTVGIADFDAFSASGESSKTIALSEISDGDRVVVFVFDGLDTIKPLYGKVIVR